MADGKSDTTEKQQRATIIACWDTLSQARAHIAGETPDETSQSREDLNRWVLEMIDEAIEDCRRTITNEPWSAR